MARISLTLTYIAVLIGIVILIYEYFTGQPWSLDGAPWTMDENFHFNIGIGFLVGAGYIFIFGAVIGAIAWRYHSNKK